ncbi:response regulator transcription factor [Pseudomonas citronellolis]|uniref:response regulator transcription factor n=1 Tax=Pseudomonas citronellolis TaxID=53408 RepID=UPI003899DEC2
MTTATTSITAHGLTGFLGKGLSLRELQCVLGIAAGRTSKELARDLDMQPATVDKRVLAATTKLGITRRAALVAEAFKRGILAPACVVMLAGMAALHPILDDDPMRRDRRPPERKTELRQAGRRCEEAGLIAA